MGQAINIWGVADAHERKMIAKDIIIKAANWFENASVEDRKLNLDSVKRVVQEARRAGR
jgi:hypothetical protein